MAYTNSSLVNYTKISPNKSSPRNHSIDTITIHCVVGQCSVETLGSLFAQSSKQASSNYGIGYDGKIGMYVKEQDRSWCSSSSANDNRAVTIEVASDTTEPYAVNTKAYNALIKLVVDICKRNGINKLVWSTSKTDRVNHKNGCNMTVHRDYANKSCPGTYLYERMGKIASAVNEQLNAEPDKPAEPEMIYRVQVGAYGVKANADAQLEKVKDAGFSDAFIAANEKGDATVALDNQANGSENNQVKTVQRILYSYGLKGSDGKVITVDGDYGTNTEYAVKTLQAKLGVPVTGKVDKDTWNAMLKNLV